LWLDSRCTSSSDSFKIVEALVDNFSNAESKDSNGTIGA
jgi:hypothetical protein